MDSSMKGPYELNQKTLDEVIPTNHVISMELKGPYELNQKTLDEVIPTHHVLSMESKDDGSTLPPADGGFLAWRFLVIIFVVDALFWGPVLCFSVLLDYPPYADMDKVLAASTGTLCAGIMYCLGSILAPLLDKYPQLHVWGPRCGVVMCGGSLVISSYATQESTLNTRAWQLLLSQGVIYSIGSSLAYYPGLIFLSEWWIKRRGFAGGIMFCGASLFGLIYPPIFDWALQRYGMPVTTRGFAVVWLIGAISILPFYHGRLPHSSPTERGKLKIMIYFKRPITWVFLTTNVLQSLAFFVPILYIPAFAKSNLGHPGGIYLGILYGTSIVGQLIFGTLSDWWHAGWLAGCISIISFASILGLWGYCNGPLMLASFVVIFGFFAGGYSCLWQSFVKLIDPSDSNPGNLVMIFVTSRGISNLVTGPITGALLNHASSEKSGYHTLIYYSAILMGLSSLGCITVLF